MEAGRVLLSSKPQHGLLSCDMDWPIGRGNQGTVPNVGVHEAQHHT